MVKGLNVESKVVPLEEIPTLQQIKQNLPSHCFKSDKMTSLYYFGRDMVSLIVLFGLTKFSYQSLSLMYFAILFPILTFFQGTIMWALFVVGHDCGHGSFSKSKQLNLIVGLIAHSVILVPFTPWRVTHRHHHKNTGHIDNDEVFLPVRQSRHKGGMADWFASNAYLGGIGWFVYQFVGGETNGKYGLFFWPGYYTEQFVEMLMSLGGVSIWLGALFVYWQSVGTVELFVEYVAPMFVFGSWLVLVTFMHHHEDEGVPWFAGDQWNYVRGNLSSVDRTFGPLLDELTHNIATHQVHHLFPIIPHYHLVEATKSFRKHYPTLVRRSHDSSISAFVTQAKKFAEKRVIDDSVTTVIM